MKNIIVQSIALGAICLAISVHATDMVDHHTMDYWAPPKQEKTTNQSWFLFNQTEEVEECTQDAQGFYDCLIRPEYPQGLLDLNGEVITLDGHMFPLEPSEKQGTFILTPDPLTCPFHLHGGPSQMVEIVAKTPIQFSYDVVKVTGTLSVEFNEETGTFYYLKGAVLEK